MEDSIQQTGSLVDSEKPLPDRQEWQRFNAIVADLRTKVNYLKGRDIASGAVDQRTLFFDEIIRAFESIPRHASPSNGDGTSASASRDSE